MADYGIKVTQPGFGVGTANAQNLVFSSKFDTFKIFSSGSGQITATLGTPQTITIAHNLGGNRRACAFYSNIYDGIEGSGTTVFNLMPYNDPIGGDGSIQDYTDTNKVLLRYGGDYAPDGSVIKYRYVIYYNVAK